MRALMIGIGKTKKAKIDCPTSSVLLAPRQCNEPTRWPRGDSGPINCAVGLQRSNLL